MANYQRIKADKANTARIQAVDQASTPTAGIDNQ